MVVLRQHPSKDEEEDNKEIRPQKEEVNDMAQLGDMLKEEVMVHLGTVTIHLNGMDQEDPPTLDGIGGTK